jgi:hypothetical protein
MADERRDVMSAKLRKALASLAAFRGISGDELAELSGLATGTIEGSMHRALAVVGGSMVEDALRRAISRHLMSSRVSASESQIFEDEHAPLATMAARTRMAFALGVIDEVARSDLTFIRGIRNAFAHSTQRLSFVHPTILDSLNQLNVLKAMQGMDELKEIAGSHFQPMRYAAAVTVYCGMLKLRRPYWEQAWNRVLAEEMQKPKPATGV